MNNVETRTGKREKDCGTNRRTNYDTARQENTSTVGTTQERKGCG